jgi:nucleotide-binding universal stress UspA family protein
VPTSALGFKRILVAADGSDASMDAVSMACMIARRNKGQVIVVHVIEVQRALPLDAEMAAEADQGEQILQKSEEIADELDFEGLEGELLQARDAGHAITDEAAERNADAIFLGVRYRAPATDIPQVWPAKGEIRDIAPPPAAPLGDVTQYVLKYAPCAVWVLRRAAGI